MTALSFIFYFFMFLIVRFYLHCFQTTQRVHFCRFICHFTAKVFFDKK